MERGTAMVINYSGIHGHYFMGLKTQCPCFLERGSNMFLNKCPIAHTCVH